MSREIRAVALDWEHPCEPGFYADGSPHYRPLYPAARLQSDLADYKAYPADWDAPPNPANYMPQLPEGTPYGWQMYEDVSEGTPLSPIFETKDELARWLASPVAGRERVSASAAARFVETGWAPSFVFSPGTGFVRGIEFGDQS